jgi:hypothetical protein
MSVSVAVMVPATCIQRDLGYFGPGDCNIIPISFRKLRVHLFYLLLATESPDCVRMVYIFITDGTDDWDGSTDLNL